MSGKKLERKTGFEPATTTLARWGSTGLSYFRSLRCDRSDGHSSPAPEGPSRERRQCAAIRYPGGSQPRDGCCGPGNSPRSTVSSHRLKPDPIRRAEFA